MNEMPKAMTTNSADMILLNRNNIFHHNNNNNETNVGLSADLSRFLLNLQSNVLAFNSLSEIL